MTALLLPLSACSSDDGDEAAPAPSAQDVAQAYAEALAAGDVSGVRFATGSGASAQESYTAVRGDLVDLTPSVRVEDVSEATASPAAEGGSETATATLAWSWPVGPDPWTYESTADLTRTTDGWAPTWAPSVVEPDLTDALQLDLAGVPGERGDVLGADGAVLVTERPVQRVGIDKSQVDAGQVQAAARALARLVGVDPKPYAKQVRASGAQAFVEAIVYRQDEEPPAVTSGLAGIAGSRSIADRLPLSPTRDFAAPLLGRVGAVTAEMVEKDPETYRAGDVAGLSGLQARYDAQLRGTPGQLVQLVDPAGATAPRELFRSDPTPGADLVLTLDERLQREAEGLLADVGPASAIVALRPSTGDVLVAANGPGNDGQNLATFGQYAPGSTFKIVSSLALLRSGLTPGSTVACTPTTTVDGKSFKNYSDYPASALGDIALRTALANSCNTAFISQRDRVGDGVLAAAAGALGLGIDHDLGFPAYFGQVDPPASETQAAADLIGQGTVLASPMTMAAVIGSVEQGATVVPRLVASPEVVPASEAPAPATPLTTQEADTLRTMLRGVVTDGSARGLADVPGAPVIAKTGTAEFGTGPDLQTHAWMVAAQGDLAVAVFVDVGASGSTTAGPIIEAFLRAAR